MANKTIKIIQNRVSLKSYSTKKVPLSKIKEIANCGKMAPTAKNRQIANITVVSSKKNAEKLRKLSLSELDRDCFYGASTMLLVHAPREDKFCIQDSSCVLENMFIAAAALDIGSCWINQVDDLFNTYEGEKLKSEFGIPKENMVVGTCILGYPSMKNATKVKERKEDFIKYI